MKRTFLVFLLITFLFSLTGCSNKNTANTDADDKKAVISLVQQFGEKLQMVSLLGPPDTVKKSMEEYYSPYLTKDLIEKFKNDPINAPGRLTSSPWPDCIEVVSATKTSDTVYSVDGKIIEVTSTEKNNEAAAIRQVTMDVVKVNGKWLISSVKLGEYEKKDSLLYINSQYGFTFKLPKSWDGYSIVTEEWTGYAIKSDTPPELTDRGSKILIRHPKWTQEMPRQDIPIMVFTLDQWKRIQNEELSVGAAPIPPTELGRNSQYVFALPARYNFSFLEGFEEVEEILKDNPLEGYNLQ